MISERLKSDRMADRDAYRDKYVSWMGGIFFAVLGTCFALQHMGQEKWLAPFDIPIRAILVFYLGRYAFETLVAVAQGVSSLVQGVSGQAAVGAKLRADAAMTEMTTMPEGPRPKRVNGKQDKKLGPVLVSGNRLAVHFGVPSRRARC